MMYLLCELLGAKIHLLHLTMFKNIRWGVTGVASLPTTRKAEALASQWS